MRDPSRVHVHERRLVQFRRPWDIDSSTSSDNELRGKSRISSLRTYRARCEQEESVLNNSITLDFASLCHEYIDAREYKSGIVD